jgi:hypothetical protein
MLFDEAKLYTKWDLLQSKIVRIWKKATVTYFKVPIPIFFGRNGKKNKKIQPS